MIAFSLAALLTSASISVHAVALPQRADNAVVSVELGGYNHAYQYPPSTVVVENDEDCLLGLCLDKRDLSSAITEAPAPKSFAATESHRKHIPGDHHRNHRQPKGGKPAKGSKRKGSKAGKKSKATKHRKQSKSSKHPKRFHDGNNRGHIHVHEHKRALIDIGTGHPYTVYHKEQYYGKPHPQRPTKPTRPAKPTPSGVWVDPNGQYHYYDRNGALIDLELGLKKRHRHHDNYHEHVHIHHRTDSADVPGTIDIQSSPANSTAATKIASLVLGAEPTRNGSFVLSATNSSDPTQVFLHVVPDAPPVPGNPTAKVVTLRMPVFDRTTVATVDYCAQFDRAPEKPTPLTANPCTESDTATDVGAGQSQAFAYTPETGVIRPLWAAALADNSTTDVNDFSTNSTTPEKRDVSPSSQNVILVFTPSVPSQVFAANDTAGDNTGAVKGEDHEEEVDETYDADVVPGMDDSTYSSSSGGFGIDDNSDTTGSYAAFDSPSSPNYTTSATSITPEATPSSTWPASSLTSSSSDSTPTMYLSTTTTDSNSASSAPSSTMVVETLTITTTAMMTVSPSPTATTTSDYGAAPSGYSTAATPTDSSDVAAPTNSAANSETDA